MLPVSDIIITGPGRAALLADVFLTLQRQAAQLSCLNTEFSESNKKLTEERDGLSAEVVRLREQLRARESDVAAALRGEALEREEVRRHRLAAEAVQSELEKLRAQGAPEQVRVQPPAAPPPIEDPRFARVRKLAEQLPMLTDWAEADLERALELARDSFLRAVGPAPEASATARDSTGGGAP